jgi:hypothetical protein
VLFRPLTKNENKILHKCTINFGGKTYTCSEFKQLATSESHPLVRLVDAFRDTLSVAGSPYANLTQRVLPDVSVSKFGILEGKFYDLVLLSHLSNFNSHSLTRAMYYILAEEISDKDLSRLSPKRLFLAAADSERIHPMPPLLVAAELMRPQSGLETHNNTSSSFPYQDICQWLMENYDTVSWYLIRIGPVLSVLRDVVLIIYFSPRQYTYYPQSGFESERGILPPQSSNFSDSGAEDGSYESPQIVVTSKGVSKDASQVSSPYWIGLGVVLSVTPLVPGILIGGSTLSGCLALSARLSYVPLAQCIHYAVSHKYNLTFTHDFSNPELFRRQSGKEKKVVHTMAPTLCNESGEPTYPPSSLMRSVTPKVSNQRPQAAPRAAQTAEAAVKAPSVFRTVGNTDFFGE